MNRCPFMTSIDARTRVDADCASLPKASTDSHATQQSKIISRGNRAIGTAPPRKIGMLGGHTQVRNSVDDGEVEVLSGVLYRKVSPRV